MTDVDRAIRDLNGHELRWLTKAFVQLRDFRADKDEPRVAALLNAVAASLAEETDRRSGVLAELDPDHDDEWTPDLE